MRAVFSIDLEKNGDAFSGPAAILQVLDDFGLGFTNVLSITTEDIQAILTSQSQGGQSRAENVDALTDLAPNRRVEPPINAESETKAKPSVESLLAHYTKLAEVLFSEMPEVAAAERKAVLYVGYINNAQTPFLVTRMVPSQITFRLLHRELPRLEGSTEAIIKRLLVQFKARHPFTISDTGVRVYERKFDHVIITGRVITNALRETFKSNLKDTLLFIVPLLLFVYTLVLLLHSPSPSQGVFHGMLERINTALLTTALVSILGLLQTFVEIRRSKVIDWAVHKDTARS